MGYDRHFTGDNSHQEALEAAEEWCTPKQMMLLRQALAGGMNMIRFRMMCSFCGFSGYPVHALIREYHSRYVRRFGPKSLQLKGEKAQAYSNKEFR